MTSELILLVDDETSSFWWIMPQNSHLPGAASHSEPRKLAPGFRQR